jgi:hypothetical protein
VSTLVVVVVVVVVVVTIGIVWTVKIEVEILRAVTPCGIWQDTNISELHAARPTQHNTTQYGVATQKNSTWWTTIWSNTELESILEKQKSKFK